MSKYSGNNRPGSKVDIYKQLGDHTKATVPALGVMLVWQHNQPLYEGYFDQAKPSTVFNIKSITKTMVSAIAGIAKGKGLMPDLNTPVISILTEYAKPATGSDLWFSAARKVNDSIRSGLTLKHLLTMTAGFDWNDFGPAASAMVASSDPVRFTLDMPFSDSPGETFNYNTGASMIFGAALATIVSEDLRSFATVNLFDKAGIRLERWDKDPQGRYVGGSEMYMTAQDLMRFGQLYLHHGRVDSLQIIPEAWIDESTAEQAILNAWPVLPGANGYGYFWWRRKSNGLQVLVASGYGGQLICVIPELDAVIVTACFLNEKNRGRQDIKRLHLCIDKVTSALKTNRSKK